MEMKKILFSLCLVLGLFACSTLEIEKATSELDENPVPDVGVDAETAMIREMLENGGMVINWRSLPKEPAADDNGLRAGESDAGAWSGGNVNINEVDEANTLQMYQEKWKQLKAVIGESRPYVYSKGTATDLTDYKTNGVKTVYDWWWLDNNTWKMRPDHEAAGVVLAIDRYWNDDPVFGWQHATKGNAVERFAADIEKWTSAPAVRTRRDGYLSLYRQIFEIQYNYRAFLKLYNLANSPGAQGVLSDMDSFLKDNINNEYVNIGADGTLQTTIPEEYHTSTDMYGWYDPKRGMLTPVYALMQGANPSHQDGDKIYTAGVAPRGVLFGFFFGHIGATAPGVKPPNWEAEMELVDKLTVGFYEAKDISVTLSQTLKTDAKKIVSWQTKLDEHIIKISGVGENCRVTPVRPGTDIITVSIVSNGRTYEATCRVTVVPPTDWLYLNNDAEITQTMIDESAGLLLDDGLYPVVDGTLRIEKDFSIKGIDEVEAKIAGKIEIVDGKTVVLDHVTFFGGADELDYWVKLSYGELTVKNSVFSGNKWGIYVSNTVSKVTIDGCAFSGMGRDDMQSIGVDFGSAATGTIRNSTFAGFSLGRSDSWDVRAGGMNVIDGGGNTYDKGWSKLAAINGNTLNPVPGSLSAALASSALRGGGTVKLSGKWEETVPFAIPENVTVEGVGGAVIELNSNNNEDMVLNGGTLRKVEVRSTHDLYGALLAHQGTIDSVAFVYPENPLPDDEIAKTAIETDLTGNLTIQNSTFGGYYKGIQINPNTEYSVRIENNVFTKVRPFVVESGFDTDKLVITDNTFDIDTTPTRFEQGASHIKTSEASEASLHSGNLKSLLNQIINNNTWSNGTLVWVSGIDWSKAVDGPIN
ncbi:hypothetical protein AGMMS49965_15870 [Bacteroidia bacterium]|nr:hypothetical protein AGMMS49965_15870 [Bacteroidia bacterium]